MNLDQYQWSRNPRGMHGAGDNHTLWDAWRLGWLKVVFENNDGLMWGGFALEKGITPIIRLYRRGLSGQAMDEGLSAQYQEHLAAGFKWFEFYNEPNLPYEWPAGLDIRPDNFELVRPLCENWLAWAEFIINGGGYPALPALAETQDTLANTWAWLESMLNVFFDFYYERFRAVLGAGAWIATHPYLLNHWYQAHPNDPARPRSMSEVRADEGGWHFEYPYDPLKQSLAPGTTPREDWFGLLGMGVLTLELLQARFEVGWLPVVGTEGGIFPLPSPSAPVHQPDARYPAYDMFSFEQGTLALFDWIAEQAPPWFFGLTLWRIEDYMNNNNPLPILGLLSDRPARLKTFIPPIPALGNAPPPYDPTDPTFARLRQPPLASPTLPPVLGGGPGPLHGVPTHHFLILAPDFPPAWFFESAAAQAYVERFRPVVLDNLEAIDLLTPEDSLLLTVLALSASAAAFVTPIQARWVYIWVDLIAVDDPYALEALLARRVRHGLRLAP